MILEPGQTQQFDTFDNREDRREIIMLFEKLGEGLPDAMANEVRAKFLAGLIRTSLGAMAQKVPEINPKECYPVGAFLLFVAITGVLEVPIREAAKRLDETVKRKEWMNDRRIVICGS